MKGAIFAAAVVLLAGAVVAAMPPACAGEWCLHEEVPAFVNLRVLIAVKQHNLKALEDTFWAVSDPDSPKYGEFLSRDEVNELTANPAGTAKVLNWVREGGITEEQMHVNTGGDFIRIDAPVAAVEKLFSAKFYAFQARGEHILVRSFSKSIPAEVEAELDFVTNVDDFPTVEALIDYKNSPKIHSHVADSDTPVIPSLLQSYYHIDKPFGSNSKNSMAVFETQGQYFAPSDLQDFQKKFDLPVKPVVNITGGNQADQPGLEAQLDVQYIGATGVNIPLTFWYQNAGFFSTFPTIIADWAAAVADDDAAPLVHSISYGLGESNVAGTPSSTFTRINNEIMKMGTRGIGVFIASGDSGVAGRRANSDPSACGFDPSWPASIPYITSVGATQWTNGNPADGETTCSIHNFPAALITSGGGFSTLNKRPSYQDAAWKAWYQPSRVKPGQKTYESTMRGIPDVSTNGHNYQIISSGNQEQVDGTSCATPAFAGMIALLNDRLMNAGKSPLGFANPSLYKAWGNDKSVFNDITTGNNKCTEGVCCSEGYDAVSGWDPATGLGTPVLNKLIAAIMTMKGVETTPAEATQFLRGGNPTSLPNLFQQN